LSGRLTPPAPGPVEERRITKAKTSRTNKMGEKRGMQALEAWYILLGYTFNLGSNFHESV
jgi:hypothetical protein